MYKVSIIIPVYNAERYLKKCLSFIVGQTYSNIEIICINDGSTDNSLQIIEMFGKKYPNIFIVNQKNAGVSVARNNGLRASTGDFVLFVDSDDYLELDTVSYCVEKIVELGVDMVRFNYKKDYHNIKLNNSDYFENEMVLYYPYEKIAEQVFENDKYCSACQVMINAKIAKKHYFNEEIAIGEDFLYFMECLYSSKKIYISNSCKYYYVLNQNSATQKFNNEKYINSIKGLIKVVDIISGLLDSHVSNVVYHSADKIKRNLKDYLYLAYQANGITGVLSLKNRILEDNALILNLKRLNIDLEEISYFTSSKKAVLIIKRLVKKML